MTIAVSCLILRKNRNTVLKILIPIREKNNSVISDILFDFYENVSQRWAFCTLLVYSYTILLLSVCKATHQLS